MNYNTSLDTIGIFLYRYILHTRNKMMNTKEKCRVRVTFNNVCYTHGRLSIQFLMLDSDKNIKSDEKLKREAFSFLQERELKGKTKVYTFDNVSRVYFSVDFQNANDFAAFIRNPLKNCQLIDFRLDAFDGKTTPEALIKCAKEIDNIRASQKKSLFQHHSIT